MNEKKISEREALNILIQVYLSHTSKWYSSVVATLIGSIGFPLLAFNLQLTAGKSIDVIYLRFFSFITISFLLGTLYFSHKVIYSLQFLEELYRKLIIAYEEKTLTDYRNKLMKQLKHYSLIFKFLVKREQKSNKKEYKLHNTFFIASFFLTLIGGFILLSFIWWPITKFWNCALIWEGILLIFISIYLLVKTI